MSLTANRRASNQCSKRAAIIAGLNLAMVMVGIILLVVAGVSLADQFTITFILTAISYSVLAALILNRHSGHMVGWIFLIAGFFPSITTLMMAIPEALSLESRLWVEILPWFGNLTFFPTYLIPITLLLQFFPDGRLPSRRWRFLPILTIIAIGGMVAVEAFLTTEYLATNPFSFSGSEPFFDLIEEISSLLFGISVLGSLLAVLTRYNQAGNTVRKQMKWLVYTTAVSILALLFLEDLINLLAGSGAADQFRLAGKSITEAILLSLPVFLSTAIGVAILRHRLFDIDIIIRRTVQYAILTALLALIYFGMVVTLQTLFSTLGGQESPIFIVISTLVIAGLFNPLRLRIQEIIDRRFYRRKYEAEQALSQFASAARDEVDLLALSSALIGVVQETIQPEHLSLWLAKSGQESGQ